MSHRFSGLKISSGNLYDSFNTVNRSLVENKKIVQLCYLLEFNFYIFLIEGTIFGDNIGVQSWVST